VQAENLLANQQSMWLGERFSRLSVSFKGTVEA
jgi:hypothetical protein